MGRRIASIAGGVGSLFAIAGASCTASYDSFLSGSATTSSTTSATGGDGATGGATGAGGPGAGGEATGGDASGGAVNVGGSGGAPDDPLAAVAALAGLRLELPCKSEYSQNVCWADDTSKQVHVGGKPGTTYSVTLRVRGVVEHKAYQGGTPDGDFQIGGNPDGSAWTEYRLDVSAPAQTYYLNNGQSSQYWCWAEDYQRTIEIAADADVTLVGVGVDGKQVKNQDSNDDPIVIPDIPPAPSPFDGQFVQIDVMAAAAL